MQKRPDMAAQLSEVLAERQMRNIRLLDGKEVKDQVRHRSRSRNNSCLAYKSSLA